MSHFTTAMFSCGNLFTMAYLSCCRSAGGGGGGGGVEDSFDHSAAAAAFSMGLMEREPLVMKMVGAEYLYIRQSGGATRPQTNSR
jgi:hypothetical protein